MHSLSIHNKSFVCNTDTKTINKYLRIAEHLGLNAWEGQAVNGFPGDIGFYVHYRITNLSQFWQVIRGY